MVTEKLAFALVSKYLRGLPGDPQLAEAYDRPVMVLNRLAVSLSHATDALDDLQDQFPSPEALKRRLMMPMLPRDSVMVFESWDERGDEIGTIHCCGRPVVMRNAKIICDQCDTVVETGCGPARNCWKIVRVKGWPKESLCE